MTGASFFSHTVSTIGWIVICSALAAQALLGKAAGGVEPSALLASHWEAVPATLPTIALAFVYQNVVPVISSSLEVNWGGGG